MTGLLAFHAHPDDETISTGALLGTWAAAGLPVTVVTCTRGERGEVIPSDVAALEGDGPALAAHRVVELGEAMAALGVGDQLFLDEVTTGRFEDSGMAWVTHGRAGRTSALPCDAFVAHDLDLAAGALARVLRDRRPQVVVGYEPGGGYGHPDHVRAHEVLMRALEVAAEPQVLEPVEGRDAGPWRPESVLWSVVDAAALGAGLDWLRTRGVPDGLELPPPGAGLPSAAEHPVELEVDVAPVLGRVVAALRAHRTQVQGVSEVRGASAGGSAVLGSFALSNGVVQPILGAECYRFAPGWGRAPVWPAGVRARVA
ncbi:PIG-L family deacetylase [Cellulomonas bogoriensis]|uniref:GlcNAc-PI de-N-acetylase n=1 Tax=Cellulomonas bogoriensis 69B4 = DSM 16987 TaxID=1386082 RepID=A0A0A0C0Z6_9CELL|nr:PIG-L family deacetylase [Cellulomonas bogoriensis]KGM13886.1 GlcNAc-PI de-N-acetylase [Cellulomonas bogoriensis 69B4 = DSM 16987]